MSGTIILEKIAAIQKDANKLIELANVCDKAYAVGENHSEWHEPFGEENPEMVAQNVVALQAVITGVYLVARLRKAKNVEEISEWTINILHDVINFDQNLTADEQCTFLATANATWGAGQAYRKGDLSRMTGVNVFALLPQVEVDKDKYQIVAAAEWLYNELTQ